MNENNDKGLQKNVINQLITIYLNPKQTIINK